MNEQFCDYTCVRIVGKRVHKSSRVLSDRTRLSTEPESRVTLNVVCVCVCARPRPRDTFVLISVKTVLAKIPHHLSCTERPHHLIIEKDIIKTNTTSPNYSLITRYCKDTVLTRLGKLFYLVHRRINSYRRR